jgi:exosortase
MPSETAQRSTDPHGFRLLGSLSRRIVFYAAWVLATCLIFVHPLAAFVSYSLSHDNASHLVLIPVISAWVVFLERHRIFTALSSDVVTATVFLAAGAAFGLLAFAAGSHWSPLNQLCLYIIALLLVWIAGFAFFFGKQTFRTARFPLAFLFLTIPIPDFLLEKAIYYLQTGSAEVAAVLFDWSGVPVLREGFVFHLANVSIEVARECSGIRSSLALFILAILVSYFYLDTFWKQVVLVVVGLFVMVLKNGVRIVTLTLLASYVDPRFLYGRLHREGGVVFFLLGLLLLAPVLWILRRGERKMTSQTVS